MFISLLYIFLAILALSFLIFIHELGHYWMARQVGMHVEKFAIGFGTPIYSWERDGVKWQIGWLPFGGYVKIAGTDPEANEDLYSISNGFYGKSPWQRIKVALMGPLSNILLAFGIFCLIWVSGGREKNFSELTKKVGWVDLKSELYFNGLRPGDEIHAYGNEPFVSAHDHFYAPMMHPDLLTVEGVKKGDYLDEEKEFSYEITPYPHPDLLNKELLTTGILRPAHYLIYDRLSGGKENPLPEGSAMQESGIQYGDRILWADGEIIYSNLELTQLLNDNRILLTVKRGQNILQLRIPRVFAQELRPTPEFREELIDWQYEAKLSNTPFQDLYVIPYNLTYDCTVENPLKFIDRESEEEIFPKHLFSSKEARLHTGDKIIAVAGIPISYAYQFLAELQQKQVNIIIQREFDTSPKLSWKEADGYFDNSFNKENLKTIVSSIGKKTPITSLGDLQLLNPVTPTTYLELLSASENLVTLAKEKRKNIEAIKDPEKRNFLLQAWDSQEKQLVLGIPTLQDQKVIYNPEPTKLFARVLQEVKRTFSALFRGSLSPKYLVGPVGIVQVIHTTSLISLKEALFWIGTISLNLGILNLIPIPPLDGGSVVLSLFEGTFKRRINSKILERIVAVFVVLIIALFLFITYNDLLRIFGEFLHWR